MMDTPCVMGILNVTPDSFSDGGRFFSVEKAVEHALEMEQSGAGIIDIGGESTRPGAQAVLVEDELERVIPVIQAIRRASDITISIDTSKPAVMIAAVEAGANLVNDVYALRQEGALGTVANLGVPVCLMHMQGEPRTMQTQPAYENVVDDVLGFLLDRARAAEEAGIARSNILLDPGFGFGKTLDHNLSLLKHLGRFVETGFPVLAGTSRKSMIGAILDVPTDQRFAGSLATAIMAVNKGAAIVRVHDVKSTVQALKVLSALNGAK